MFRYLKKHYLLAAFLPLIVSWGLISLLIPQGLHNDDFQLYFQFCNGGENSIPYSMHSGVLLGFLLMGMNHLTPLLNWYLIFLHLTGSAACLGLNLFVTSRCSSASSGNAFLDTSRLIGALGILSYINFYCIYFSQYTHTAILCACASIFLLYDWMHLKKHHGRLIYSIILFVCAYELRDQAIFPFFILAAGCTMAGLLFYKRIVCCGKWKGLLLFPVLLITLISTDNLVFKASPHWHEAKKFCQARIEIQDIRDNSGISKNSELSAAGIAPEDFSLFRTFTYVPGFCEEDSEFLKKARDIHKAQRKGLFGSDTAARFDILSREGYEYKAGITFLRAITPWMPIAAGLIILIPGISRQGMSHALPMLMAILIYFGILLLYQRVPGRVLNPVLYAGGAWILASPLLANRLTTNKVYNLISVSTVTLITLFCFREIRWFFSEPGQAWKHCAQNPKNLYLTTSMQHIGITPTGWKGASLQYFATTNIIPIADGWCFYTPAYRTALQARGITNPYAEICKPDTYIVTQNNTDEAAALRLISKVHQRQFGQTLQFHPCSSVGNFSFWQATAAHQDPKTQSSTRAALFPARTGR